MSWQEGVKSPTTRLPEEAPALASGADEVAAAPPRVAGRAQPTA